MTDEPRIRVMTDGPLLVSAVTLSRVVKGDPAPDRPPRWTAERIEGVPAVYALCRCGGSGSMPLCDRWPNRPCFRESPASGVRPTFTWRPRLALPVRSLGCDAVLRRHAQARRLPGLMSRESPVGGQPRDRATTILTSRPCVRSSGRRRRPRSGRGRSSDRIVAARRPWGLPAPLRWMHKGSSPRSWTRPMAGQSRSATLPPASA